MKYPSHSKNSTKICKSMPPELQFGSSGGIGAVGGRWFEGWRVCDGRGDVVLGGRDGGLVRI